jgi:hypothetical protein
MGDSVDSLLIDVRANTQGFAQDVAAMRSSFDGTLLDGFERAGTVLERGLLSALRKGSLGFEDLRRIALGVIDQIAAQAIHNLFAGVGQGNGGGIGGLLNFGGLLGSILGLPGRAKGGPVAPDRGYLVGERGPELFVPTSAGRIEAGLLRQGAGPEPTGHSSLAPVVPAPREVKVSINITAPPGTGGPQALQRSSRQVASAVRRALNEF